MPITPHLSGLLPTTPSSSNSNSTFDSNALTSSPVDFTTFRSNNMVLKTLLRDSAPLPPDVQQYIRCVTSAAEKIYVKTSILEEQVQAQGEALGKRKQVLNS
jgi:hypothetical protein